MFSPRTSSRRRGGEGGQDFGVDLRFGGGKAGGVAEVHEGFVRVAADEDCNVIHEAERLVELAGVLQFEFVEFTEQARGEVLEFQPWTALSRRIRRIMSAVFVIVAWTEKCSGR